MPIEEKIDTIAVKMYGAKGISFSADAKKDLEDIKRLGLARLPVCVAKTPQSLSDNPALIGRARGRSLFISSRSFWASALNDMPFAPYILTAIVSIFSSIGISSG